MKNFLVQLRLIGSLALFLPVFLTMTGCGSGGNATTGTPTNTVATPGFTPAGGTYSTAQAVTITTTTSGATIRYTTDGSTPTVTNGTVYSGPVTISATTTLQAIAYESGYTDSSVASATYTISSAIIVATPTFSPVAGTYSTAQTVTIMTATSGATIRYTTDGSTPSQTNGTIYSGPVTISATTTLQAIAYKTGDTNSIVASATYTITLPVVATPTFSPVAGTYSTSQTVTIATSTSGATIRYTIDGSTPTETHGTIYSGPISISTSTTLQAIAYESGYTDSSVPTAGYTISIPVATPGFSPGGGTYTTAQSVTITTSTSGATIRYTTDGSTPSETNGTIYTGPVTISATTTLQAIAYEAGYTDSGLASATYTISSAVTVATPIFSPAGGSYTTAQTVTITTSTSGATIRYTIDGSTPSETNGTIYTGPVTISTTTTLRAIAYKTGDTDSSIASDTYTINTTSSVATPTFSPAAGPFYAATPVTITSITPGAAIYYTTDGTTPSPTNGTLYAGPVTMQVAVDTNMTATTAANGSGVTMLKAVAYVGATASNVFTGNYIIIVPLRYAQTSSMVLGLAHFAYNVSTANWDEDSGIWTNDLGYAVVQATGTSPNRFELLKINDQQFIELYEVTALPGTGIGGYPAQWQLRNFGFYVTDAAAFLASLPTGINLISGVTTNALGNLSFFTQDPDGHMDEWVQYMPGSVTSNTLGQYMPGTQLFGYMENYGDATGGEPAADAYYNKFGFTGSGTKIYLPNSNCYLEMLTYKTLTQQQAGVHGKAQLTNFRGLTIQQSAAIVLQRDPNVTYITGTEGGNGFPTHYYYDLYDTDLSRIRLIDINY